MSHINVSPAEDVLEREFKVLDHGFVRLVDYMGGDARIIQSARITHSSKSKNTDSDQKLINYLMKNEHWSPFEQVVLTFHIKMPMFVMRQWVRHRTARLNEISGRYTELRDECYVPGMGRFNLQDTKNKQGSSDEYLSEETSLACQSSMEAEQGQIFGNYKKYLDYGLAKEVARIDLPLSTYTEIYWQMDLRNLYNFLKQRLDSHAQWEIRQYAEKIALCARLVAPMAYETFENHVLYSKKFSRDDRLALDVKLDNLLDTPLTDSARGIIGELRSLLMEGL